MLAIISKNIIKGYRIQFELLRFSFFRKSTNPNLAPIGAGFGFAMFGRPEEIQTLDPYNANVVYSQLSYVLLALCGPVKKLPAALSFSAAGSFLFLKLAV